MLDHITPALQRPASNDWFEEALDLYEAARTAFLYLSLSRDERDLEIAKVLQVALHRAEGR